MFVSWFPDFEAVRAHACDRLPFREQCYSLADWLFNSNTAHVGEKALLMVFILFVLLSLLARFNGIKKKVIWPRDIPHWDDHHNPGQGILLVKQRARPGVHRFVVLSYQNIPENYWDALNKRDAYIKFKWLRNGNGKPEKESALEDDFTIYVDSRMGTDTDTDATGNTAKVDFQHIGLDENSYTKIRNYFGQIAEREDSRQRIDNANFVMEVSTRKLRGIYFLLFKQPDPTFRITGWVVVLTGVFSIFQSMVFG
jgi:hypothetical protein